MIPSEVAGILFTANPVTGNRDEAVVNASWGLGEAIVSAVTPDMFTVRKSDGAIVGRVVADKQRLIEVLGGRRDGGARRARRASRRPFAFRRPGDRTGRPLQPDRGPLRRAHGHRVGPCRRPLLHSPGARHHHSGRREDRPAAGTRGRCRPRTANTAAPCSRSSSPTRCRPASCRPSARCCTACWTSPSGRWVSGHRRTLDGGGGKFYRQPYFHRGYIEAALEPLSPAVRQRLVAQVMNPFAHQGRGRRRAVASLRGNGIAAGVIHDPFAPALPAAIERYRADIREEASLAPETVPDGEIVPAFSVSSLAAPLAC